MDDALSSQGWTGAYEKASVERWLSAATAERERLRAALTAARARVALAADSRAIDVSEIMADARREAEEVRAATVVRIGTILSIAEAQAADLVAGARSGLADDELRSRSHAR